MKMHWMALIGLSLASCASTGDETFYLGGPPAEFLSYPAQNLEGIVYAKAKYPFNQESIFDVDLVEEIGVIPVQLEVRLQGKATDEAQILLDPNRMNLRLYLQDGVALPQVDVEEVVAELNKSKRDKVLLSKFEGGLLTTESIEGYVFFAMRPKDQFRVEGGQVVHASGRVSRSLEIDRSLLAFNVTIDDLVRPFFVGIRP